jgi:MoxR-like ATPase
MSEKIEEITQRVRKAGEYIPLLSSEIKKVIVGQSYLTERLILALITGEHILLEGLPGLAKTTSVNTLAQTIQAKFKRIQFTPDLLPADLLGTQVFQPKTGDFTIKKGPLFSNIILADEINRAPAKVQSALLEAMQERQITIGGETFPLSHPFMVIATQNPIENEGTYPLPEAQVDRFMLKLKIDYPTKEEEKVIMQRMSSTQKDTQVQKIIQPDVLVKTREVINSIYIDNNLEDYILNLVTATRNPETQNLSKLTNLIQYGASPRASIFLHRLSKAYAFMQGRGFVVPQDIKTIGFDVLRHRVILTYEAEAENISTDDILKEIFDTVQVP